MNKQKIIPIIFIIILAILMLYYIFIKEWIGAIAALGINLTIIMNESCRE